MAKYSKFACAYVALIEAYTVFVAFLRKTTIIVVKMHTDTWQNEDFFIYLMRTSSLYGCHGKLGHSL